MHRLLRDDAPESLKRDDRGSSILELLLTLIPLFLFIGGAMDIGGISGAKLALIRSSHAAVEEMQKSGYYDSTAQSALQSSLTGQGVNPNSVSVSTSPPATAGSPAWVIESYNLAAPVNMGTSQYSLQDGSSGMVFP